MTDTQERADRQGIVARAGRWASKHPRRVLIAWVALLLVAQAASSGAGTKYINGVSLNGTDSQRTTDLLKREFPSQAGDSDQIVLHTRSGNVTDPSVRAEVTPVLARIAQLPHVTGVLSPFTLAGARGISPDRHIAFATVTFDLPPNDLPTSAINRVISTAGQARSANLQVEPGGQAIEQTQKPTLGPATFIGLLAAIVILLFTFGSAVAMGLPIATAALGLGTALGLAGLSTHIVDTPDFATSWRR